MALFPEHTLPDFPDLHLALEEWDELLNPPCGEQGTQSDVAEAPGSARDAASVLSLPEGQGSRPLSSEDYVSVLDDLLECLRPEQGGEDTPGSSDPYGPLEQGPTLLAGHTQTCPEALPASATAAPAAPPAAPPPVPPAAAEEQDPRSHALGPDKSKPRTHVRFSPYQRQALTDSFKANRNPAAQDVKALAAELHLSTTQVRTWFRNHRKKFKYWFARSLKGDQEADEQTLRAMTRAMSCRTGAGYMARSLLNH